jgi:indolepyruvate ferredoxin oxidoreductase
MLAYVRANKLNYNVIDSPRARFGIISSGKAYLDTRQALWDLGLDDATCAHLGIRLHKVNVVWPLEATITREFATGLEEILVVEEKRQIIEYALKEELYNWRDDVRPRVYGKFDEKEGGEWAIPQSNWLLPAHYELSPALIAKAIANRLLRPGGRAIEMPSHVRHTIMARLEIIEAKERELLRHQAPAERVPAFCSGCPHNTSTHVPEGSRALGGIGCHYMATWMPERKTETFSQMGGEGVAWIGQAPFTNEPHVFANLGDGTYFHSGSLAVRASIAAGTNITYKILYNDAVAMTGGQPIDGALTVSMIAQQMAAEGARKIVVVTDEVEKYGVAQGDAGEDSEGGEADASIGLPRGVVVFHRSALDSVQRMLRHTAGCTILIYDQTCASEKRRRRKKIVDGVPGFLDPAVRVFINEAVCEGCGDCSVQSSCLSVEPIETEFGRKRRINQSSCNKDYSCVNGFCPSFVTVHNAKPRKGSGVVAQDATTPGSATLTPPMPDPPEPVLPSSATPWRILITGVGGTGVVTIGQLLGMAAHLEGKALTVLDMAGLAQKGGAVMSHVQIADCADDLHATRIAMGEAHLIIGGDAIVTASTEALSKIRSGRTHAVLASTLSPTSTFLRDPDWQFPLDACERQIEDALGNRAELIDAQRFATALLGDGIYANPFLLGYAWQRGWVPLMHATLMRAIELNGASVARNHEAFEWGRRAAHDRAAVERLATPAQSAPAQVIRLEEVKRSLQHAGPATEALDALVANRSDFLTQYQNSDYALRYTELVTRVRRVEFARLGSKRLAEAAARYLFKLMAYKDEYEVARLHSDPAFMAQVQAQFEPADASQPLRLEYHLAPPLLARRNARGELVKQRYGAWVTHAFWLLAKLRFLRGSRFDMFGMTAERRQERSLVEEYFVVMEELLAGLAPHNLETAIKIARLPEDIRGYGHVKERHLKLVRERQKQLLADFRGGPGSDGHASASVHPLHAA